MSVRRDRTLLYRFRWLGVLPAALLLAPLLTSFMWQRFHDVERNLSAKGDFMVS